MSTSRGRGAPIELTGSVNYAVASPSGCPPGALADDGRFAQTHGCPSRWPPMTEDGKPLETLLEQAARARRLALVLHGDPAAIELEHYAEEVAGAVPKWKLKPPLVLAGRRSWGCSEVLRNPRTSPALLRRLLKPHPFFGQRCSRVRIDAIPASLSPNMVFQSSWPWLPNTISRLCVSMMRPIGLSSVMAAMLPRVKPPTAERARSAAYRSSARRIVSRRIPRRWIIARGRVIHWRRGVVGRGEGGTQPQHADAETGPAPSAPAMIVSAMPAAVSAVIAASVAMPVGQRWRRRQQSSGQANCRYSRHSTSPLLLATPSRLTLRSHSQRRCNLRHGAAWNGAGAGISAGAGSIRSISDQALQHASAGCLHRGGNDSRSEWLRDPPSCGSTARPRHMTPP